MAKSDEGAIRSHVYELGHSDRELKRLGTQAQLVNPITRRYFIDAGVAVGMRVLNIGSGAGDVAFLAAELVGDSGQVIGTDRSPTAVSTARTRAQELSLNTVSFREGDPADLDFEEPFDAIVGRYVLMFSPNPVAMLKGIKRHLKPRGVIVFHEVDWTGARSIPPAPIYDFCCDSIVQTFRKVGTNPNMGIGLWRAFIDAGLQAPTMGLHALIGGGPNDLSGIDLIADLATTMVPVMEQSGVASAANLAPDSLEQRMRAEATANGSVVIGRYEVGAWSRLV